MKFLYETEVASHVVFKESIKESLLQITEESVELRLVNIDTAVGTEVPLLGAMLIFEADTFEDALRDGKKLLEDLLDAISCVTSMKLQFLRSVRLIDWSEGKINREYEVFHVSREMPIPEGFLDEELLASAGKIWRATKDHPLQLAIHWFSQGVAAVSTREQFQLFWFAIELAAQVSKNIEKINDLCAICRNPLYCEECKTHSKHRPYPKQAIKQLIETIVDNNGDAIFKSLNSVRNSLMHGENICQIEKSANLKLETAVD